MSSQPGTGRGAAGAEDLDGTDTVTPLWHNAHAADRAGPPNAVRDPDAGTTTRSGCSGVSGLGMGVVVPVYKQMILMMRTITPPMIMLHPHTHAHHDGGDGDEAAASGAGSVAGNDGRKCVKWWWR